MKKLLALFSALLLAATPAWATFPTIQTTAVTNGASTASPASVNLPASLAAGDLLVVFFGCSCTTITTPTNWTQLDKTSAAASDATEAIYYKTSDGTEGATLSITFTGTVKYAAVSYRITGWGGTPTAGTAVGNSTNNSAPDPPSVTAVGGSADNLFIASAESASNAGLTTAPTNYGSGLNGASTTSGTQASQNTAIRNLTGATDNPSAFTLSTTGHTVAETIVIAPAPVSHGGLLTLGVGG